MRREAREADGEQLVLVVASRGSQELLKKGLEKKKPFGAIWLFVKTNGVLEKKLVMIASEYKNIKVLIVQPF